jgi:RNA polymerase sigma-70 factor (ECF subfamily)
VSEARTSPALPDEGALVERARAGDREAAGTLLRAYYPRLWSVCRRTVADPRVTEDLVQDAMVRIISGLPGFAGDAAFSTWAIRITMNVCLSHLRKVKVRESAGEAAVQAGARPTHPGPVEPGATPHETMRTREPGPGGSVEQEERSARLVAAMESLDEGYRQVLVLRDMQGLDYAAIGHVLGIAVGTVKSRLFRARAALRAALEEAESAESAESDTAPESTNQPPRPDPTGDAPTADDGTHPEAHSGRTQQ